MSLHCDLVIRNGDVVDGSGAPRFGADVGIVGDRIVAIVRRDDGTAARLRAPLEIDATGRVVAPGFIDVHTHDDTALIANPTMAMKASQGVTTVVCGNCGVSAAPVLQPALGPMHLDRGVFSRPRSAQSHRHQAHSWWAQLRLV
jgi:N-acyl-D-amino-acid deacylase